MARLNQLLVLSQQLEEDIRHLGSHKYIAHQLSVLYVRTIKCNFLLIPNFAVCSLISMLFFFHLYSQQVISSFRGIPVFSAIKKDIEANFKQMKRSLVAGEGCRSEPQLAAHYINW